MEDATAFGQTQTAGRPIQQPGVEMRAYKEMVTKKLGERFAYLTKHFKDRDYLLGNQFSVADAYLFTILRWSKSVHIQLEPWPVLTEFLARVRARSKVSEVMKAEGLAN